MTTRAKQRDNRDTPHTHPTKQQVQPSDDTNPGRPAAARSARARVLASQAASDALTWDELFVHLVAVAGGALSLPCTRDPDTGFTSDQPARQVEAAKACQRCPGLNPCRRFGIAHPGESGVYGGLTEAQRCAIARSEARP